MRIGISSLGNNLEAQVDPRLGRCQYIIIFDTDTNQFESVQNPNVMSAGGAGIQTAQLIADKNVEVVITGNVGPNAFRTLSAASIKVYGGATGTIRKAIEDFNQNKLTEFQTENVGGHFGMRG